MNGQWRGLWLCMLLPASAAAENLEMPRSDEAIDLLSPKVMAASRPQWQAAQGEAGAAWGGFLEWPSVTGGLLLDSNPLQEHAGGRTQLGARLAPRIVVERENGLHDTVFYGRADARVYPSAPRADQFEGRAGVLHDWAITRDLLLRAQVDVSRSMDRIDNRQVVTGHGGGVPFERRDATASGSVQKSFDRLFVSMSGTIAASRFQDAHVVRTTAGEAALSSQTAFTLRGRVGYWLTPAVFTFAEPSANWRVLDAGDQRSSGERIVAGLGTDRISLFSGAVYGGVQRQVYPRSPSEVSEPVVGGDVAWRPDRGWTVEARVDRRLDQAAVGTAAEPLGTPIEIRSGTLTVTYAPGTLWSVEGGVVREAVRYLATDRRDTLTEFDASLTYEFRHNLALTADIRFTKVGSTRAMAAYERAMATFGAVYRY